MHAPFAHIYIPIPPHRKKSCIRTYSGPGYKARGPSAEEDSVDLKQSTQYVVYTVLCTLSSFMTKRPPWSILYCRVEQVNEIIQAYDSGKIAIVDSARTTKVPNSHQTIFLVKRYSPGMKILSTSSSQLSLSTEWDYSGLCRHACNHQPHKRIMRG